MPMPPQIRRLLDSDDEYPDCFEELENNEEAAIYPAYLRDDRFNSLDFTCIKEDKVEPVDKTEENYQIGENINESPVFCTLQRLEQDLYRKTRQLKGNKSVVVETGVLSRQDLACLRVVEPCLSDAGLLWFLNYLKYRDLQKVCAKHLISCLAVDHNTPAMIPFKDEASFQKLHNFYVSVL